MAAGLTVLCCAAVAAAPRPSAPPAPVAPVAVAPLTSPIRLAAPVRLAKGGGKSVYIVKLKEAGAASYAGAGAYSAATRGTQSASAVRAARAAYAQRLEQTHDRLLSEVGAPSTKLYSYRYALNGFAARLTAAEAARLAQLPAVDRVWLDSDQRLHTNNSSTFLGLTNPKGGLRADLKLTGENVVVGVVDSGVAPNHPSLLDTVDLIPRGCRTAWAKSSWLGLFLCSGYNRHPLKQVVYAPPVGFSGKCETGPGFAPSGCSNKVVGARFYVDGFLERHELDPHEFRSPRDAAGHGTHVATTIAGNSVDASLFGTKVARVSGLAPRARVAIYKACWMEPGGGEPTCSTSDLARAVDDAVADGVDLINYSLGTTLTDLTAPDGLALLNAFDAGVLAVVAAGNDGPDYGTITAPSSAPWVLTVGASTQTGTVFDAAIAITAPASIAGNISMREASFTPALAGKPPIEQALVYVTNAQSKASGSSTHDGCQALTNATSVRGNIALIVRGGGCEFQVKIKNAESAGAVGVVVYNDSGAPIVMNGDAGVVHIPAVMISSTDGQKLVAQLTGTGTAAIKVTVRLAKGIYSPLTETGNRMADFSSRGPSQSDANFLKPDVTAPGIDILAGTTPTPTTGVQGERYAYNSGTSQAAPEVTGVAALLKQAHPDWPPGTLKSALMTSSYQQVVNSDGTVTSPFDRGAGHIDPNRAIDPGLVYANAYRDHATYLCGLLKPPYPPADCVAIAAAGLPSTATDVNLPSIAVAELITGDVVKRRVTNVGPPATYSATLVAPADLDVVVDPATLVLGTGQSGSFSLRVTNKGAQIDQWEFGELRWSDGAHTVVSPLALQPVALRTSGEVRLSGSSGSAALPVAFGYDGPYTPHVHGLRAPLTDSSGRVLSGHVDDDPSNTFDLHGPGVTLHGFTVQPGQLYLRVALFDDFTDGADDLDLYLFFCPDGTTASCTQIDESGSFTSNEEIDVTTPTPGLYVAAVHGFETDQVAGGPGANYSIFIWGLGIDDAVGNLGASGPSTVSEGDRVDVGLTWGQLSPSMRYLGAITHDTPFGIYALTILDVASP
ncbi:MAG TPA: S8 family serine peptidase [Gammaproteobacteria bacterium]|nr:S8 family serine peptidase [Gammaproteobacteria bacterium]